MQHGVNRSLGINSLKTGQIAQIWDESSRRHDVWQEKCRRLLAWSFYFTGVK
jgi:hypothetical protein